MCSICSLQRSSINKYLRHLECVHECQANFSVTCNLNGCPRTYRSVKSLRQHMRDKHSAIYHGQINNGAGAVDDVNLAMNEAEAFDDYAEGDVDMEPTDEVTAVVKTPINMNDFLLGLQKHFALFVLKTGEQHGVPSVVQHEIAEEVRSFFTNMTSSFNCYLISHLKDLGIEVNEDDDLRKLFQTQAFFNKALSSVSSQSKILAYCKSNLGYIAPREIPLILPPADDGTPAAKKTFQYIPILPVLQRMIELPGVYDSISRKQIADGEKNVSLLTSFADGTACNEHAVFGIDKNAIRIHMYIDEFEVCCPIGAHRVTYKMCAFYFFIGNLEDQHHSKLKFIHLCLLVKESCVKTLKSYAQILRPLIADLNVLQNEGILINLCHDKTVRLYGAVATVSSDNLSAHALAGFRRTFNSGRICRFCMIQYDQREEILSDSEVRWRTEPMHREQLQAVLQHGIDSNVYGVERHCPFLDLSYFNVTSSFPPDLMHDLLEGFIPVTLKFVLNSFGRALPIAEVNAEIQSFSFGKNDVKNKPVLLPASLTSANIIGSASEKLCLFKILPFLIGYRVAADNKFWLMYLQLREIVDHVMSPSFPVNRLSYLQTLIQEFLFTFTTLLPGKMTPKFHFFLHYPTLIAKYGPLKYLWCMRFEAKHQYFKKLSSVGRNFKNIAKTLAKRHQLRQCWEFTATNFLGDCIECSGEVSFFFSNLTPQQQDLIIRYYDLKHVSQSEVVWKCSVLTLGGNTYKVHDVTIAALLHAEDVPLFYKIYQILKIRGTWFFLGKLFISRSFSSHLHAFQVSEEDDFTVLQPSELCDHQLLDCYTIQDGLSYVSLKYLLFS